MGTALVKDLLDTFNPTGTLISLAKINGGRGFPVGFGRWLPKVENRSPHGTTAMDIIGFLDFQLPEYLQNECLWTTLGLFSSAHQKRAEKSYFSGRHFSKNV